MLWVPKGTSVGLMFVERVGGSHLHDPLLKYLLQPAAHAESVTIKAQGYADAEAWARYIDDAEQFRVRSIWAPSTAEQRVEGGRQREEGKLSMQLDGNAAERAARGLVAHVRSKFMGEGSDDAPVLTPREITPALADDYKRERLEVNLTDADGKQKTLIVERNDPPTFIYDLEDRVDSASLRQTWDAEIDRLSNVYGPDVIPS